MATTFSIKGAKKITITNTSVDTVVNFSDAVISPTLIPSAVSSETVPAMTVFVPSFKTLKVNAIKPDEVIDFVTSDTDEILYYKSLQEKPIEGCTVKIEDAPGD